MSRSDSFKALEHANPRSRSGFGRAVQEADARRKRITAPATVDADVPARVLPARAIVRRRSRLSAAAVGLVAASIVATLLIVGGVGGGGPQSASAAVMQAAAATASSAESSGTVTVRITHDGERWAEKTVSWNGGDVSILDRSPGGAPGHELRVVDGVMYGNDDQGRWVELGSPDSIDPDSGTTPDEYLAATRADVTGDTLRDITANMQGLTADQLADGSAVYRGAVRAGLVAPEAGFKEGEHIRVFPFGYVAHGEADDPSALIDAAVTVGPDGLIRELAVDWGGSGSAWAYTVTYADLGSTAPIVAPPNAEPFARMTTAAATTG